MIAIDRFVLFQPFTMYFAVARAFQFVTLDGSFNILQNCSISQFVTVRSSKEFRGVSIALSALRRAGVIVCFSITGPFFLVIVDVD